MKSGGIISLNFFQYLARGENNTEPDFLKFKDLTHTLKTAFNTNKKADRGFTHHRAAEGRDKVEKGDVKY